jgi:hypothetical protein
MGLLTCAGVNGRVDAGAVATSSPTWTVHRPAARPDHERARAAQRCDPENYNSVNLPDNSIAGRHRCAGDAADRAGIPEAARFAAWSQDAFGQRYVPGPSPVQEAVFAGLP